MKKRIQNPILNQTLTLACASFAAMATLGPVPQAEAVTITYSDKTQRIAPYFDFRGDYDLPFNLNVSGALGFTPDLSSFVPPLAVSTGSGGSDLLSQAIASIKWDTLFDLQLNAGYNFQLLGLDLGIGKISTTLTPYAGYRHMFTSTGSLTATPTNSQLMGMNYGAKLKLGLPLGFSGYGYVGASTLFGGSIDQGSGATPINTKNMTLPEFGLGAAWNLPIFNLASVYLGYRGFFLPSDLRLSNSLDNGTSMVHGLNGGINILFFGI
ncbi:MAG: hypothetical protein IV090_24805 [Candidatus Sericytochromatia bacterium]|nr:hypothetical protein [Candidatus Sericytochromatia bacterium]